MKSLLALSLLPLATQGFIAPSRVTPSVVATDRKGKSITRFLDQPDALKEDVLGQVETEQLLSEVIVPATAELASSDVDVGKELFLRNLPASAELASADFDVTEESNNDFPARAELASVDFDVTKESDNDTDFQSLSIQENFHVDNVSAVLAVSGEAAAAAEATLPADISETLLFQRTSDVSSKISASEPVDAPVREILPASSIVGEPITKKKITAPSVSKILKFAVPAIGVWLCGPLLSLIDTSSVGLLSGTSQQAALNPAVAVTDYAALLIAFLYTGTTNLIAAARESDRDTEGMPRTAKTFVGALQLSTYVGAGLGLVLFCFARVLLRSIIGNDSISPAVFDAAMKYVRIRALGMPAAAIIGSAQAACLGMQDIRSPLYVLGVAAAVNFMGDMMFVAQSHPWIGGAAGAAWATVFSQYAAVAMFVRWLSSKPKEPSVTQEETPSVNLSKAILELTGKPRSAGASRRKRFRDSLRSFRMSAGSKNEFEKETVIKEGHRLSTNLPKAIMNSSQETKDEEISVRGFLNNRFRGRDLLRFPNKDTAKEVGEYLIPVTSTQVGRVSGYVAMSHVVSSSLGTISMAAQQVIVSLFYCLCPIADSLSLTAQSFIPSIQEKKPSVERTDALRTSAVNFAKAGAVFGGFMTAFVSCIPLLSGFFTTDLYVASLVNMVAPLLIGFFSLHGVVCAMEGVLLGRKDLGFLGRMYSGFFFVLPYFLLRIKRAALSGAHSVNLKSVWNVFLGYQLFRFVAWSGRVAHMQRRTQRETQALGERP